VWVFVRFPRRLLPPLSLLQFISYVFVVHFMSTLHPLQPKDGQELILTDEPSLTAFFTSLRRAAVQS
jgi:hypothetical protein